MAKDDLDFDALGLGDEELGLTGGTDGGGASGRGGGDGGGGPGRGRRGLVLFLLGLALGVGGALLVPRFLAPYLPTSLRDGGEVVEGEVLGKRVEGERLLLTVETPRGAVLATFRERVGEIDLLVDTGDSVALGLGRYRPFVDDPSVEGVRKAASRGHRPAASDTPAARLDTPEATASDTPAAGLDTPEPAALDTPAAGPDTPAASDAGAPDGPETRNQEVER